MKSILNHIFVTLGVIFLILIFIGIYLFVTDLFNVKPLIFGSNSAMVAPKTDDSPSSADGAETGATAGFQLSEGQRQALINLGIDPAAVPTSVTPEQEACFVTALGEARVAEIKTGAVPNAIEFMKAKSCI